MNFSLQPVQVATGSQGTESHLVFADGLLVAVLARLSEEYAADAGRWHLEAGFGRVADPKPPTFADMTEAQAWIAKRLSF